MRRLSIVGGLCLALVVVGLASGGVALADPSATPLPPHVMEIVLENTDYSQVIGSNAMPYLNELTHQYASFSDGWGENGESLVNYLELLDGSTQGVTSDCDISQALSGGHETPCSGIGAGFTSQTLTDQMTAAGISWKAYFQGDATGCDQSDGGGNYAYWHNPFRYFADFATECKQLDNFNDLSADLNSAQAPDFALIVPDLVSDGGDSGTMSSGDTWLASELPQIMASNWYQQGGQIIITWDSGFHSGTEPGTIPADGGPFKGGHIDTIVVSGATQGYGVNATKLNHAGIVRSIESAYGLPLLADAQQTDNGSLGNALVSTLPQPTDPTHSLAGAVLNSAGAAPGNVTVTDGALNLSGITAPPGAGAADPQTAIEVGIGANGDGIVISPQHGPTSVAGTSNLESVACTTATQCYAVGLGPNVADYGPLNDDEAVLVSINNGVPGTVTPLPKFIGLYGIACPTTTTCYAVGYDNNTGHAAVATITNGVVSAPADTSQGEWLNSIECVSATQCYGAGLINYIPTIVPITNGVPGTPVSFSSDDYEGGLACTSVGNCLMVGENKSQQGVIMPLVNGAAGTPVSVPGTEYLYGVGCATSGDCLLTGAAAPDANGFSWGVVDQYSAAGALLSPQIVPQTSGFGQTVCGATVSDCLSVGAAVLSQDQLGVPVGGSVASTLGVSIGSSSTPTLGSFVPGTSATYSTTVPASITTTAQTSTLEASDTSSTFPGHLVNTTASGGPYELARGLQVDATSANAAATGGGTWFDLTTADPATILTYTAPVSNDAATIGFQQPVAATDPLRTGTYGKTITITLSTNSP